MNKIYVLLVLCISVLKGFAQCPSVTVTPVSQTYTCNAAPVTFTAVFSPTANISARWIGPGGSPIMLSNASPLIFSTSNPGTYTFEATNNLSSCVTTQTVSVIAGASVPSFSVISISGYELNCATSSLVLWAQSNSTLSPKTYSYTNMTTSVTTWPATGACTITSPGQYYVQFKDANNCQIGQMVTITSNTVPPNGFITPLSGTLTCTTTLNTFTAIATPSNNISIIWTDGSSLLAGPATSPLILSAGAPGIFYAIFNDVNGCSSTKSITILSNTTTPVINTIGNNTVCLGSSANLTAVGANSYTWSTGALTNSINVLPSTSTIYTVSGTGSNGCIGTNTISVFTNTTCSDVWPGDSNSDGVSNTLDILEIGLQFSQSGFPRSLISNSWNSYFANNWTGLISTGKNRCHADCNGDGNVNTNDVTSVSNNFSLTHSFKMASPGNLNSDMYIVPDQNLVQIGKWGTASVFLGDATTSVTNIHGLVFDLIFDNTLIETDSIYFEYINTFINAGVTNIEFQKNSFINGAIYAADTRTNQINASGYGKIGVLHFKAVNNLVTDAILNLGVTNVIKTNSASNFSNLTGGTTSLTITTSAIGINENTMDNRILHVFPNPNNGSFFIQIQEDADLGIVNELGQIIKIVKVDNSNNRQATISGLTSGVYCIKDNLSGRVIQNKIVVMR